MGSKKVILVDGNNRLYASFFAYDSLSFEGKSTSAIYGMPCMLRALLNKWKPDQMYIVWDGHEDNKAIRRKIYPDYKNDSKRNTQIDLEGLIRQKLIVQSMFNYLGVKQILNPKLEGDDTIYSLARVLRKRYDVIIINTGDKDFNQMINKQVKIYSESKKKLITRKNAKETFGYSPEETVDWLCLTGDTSDQIPGLNGCGEKTSRELLDKYGSISNFLESGDKFPRVNRDELLEIYPRNRKLIDLSYFHRKYTKGTKPLHYLFSRKPKQDLPMFRRLAATYGIRRFLDPNFSKPFNL